MSELATEAPLRELARQPAQETESIGILESKTIGTEDNPMVLVPLTTPPVVESDQPGTNVTVPSLTELSQRILSATRPSPPVTAEQTLSDEVDEEEEVVFRCSFPGCDKTFRKPFKLDRHMRTHDKKRPFSCDWPNCTKTFTRQDHLKRHKDMHQLNFQCGHPGCFQAFNTKDKLKRHLAEHDMPLPYRCGFAGCDRSFKRKQLLQKHQETHEGARPYPCKACGEAFATYLLLRRHRKAVHLPKEYKCDAKGCGQEFSHFRDLAAHREREHPELCVFHCPVCDKYFPTAKQRSKHASIHKKNFRCEQPGCGKAFSSGHNLRTHVNMVHLKLRPFECNALGCLKSFSTKGSLKRHISKVHSYAVQKESEEKRKIRLISTICGTFPSSSGTDKKDSNA